MGKHDHPHVEASGASLAKAAQTALEGAGEAWTDMRAEIFDAVAEIGKPASAYEIADIVSKNRGKRVAPNSVYRILDLFVANSHPGCLHDCIFLICDTCGSAVHVDDDKLSTGVRAAAEKTGFAAERPVIEVRGKCAECQ